MNSKLYNGYVEHGRSLPTTHEFKYSVYFYALDLDELAELDHRIPFFGYNRLRPSAIFDEDYLDKGSDSIKDKLRARLKDHGLDKAIAKVVLVTSARYLNYVFNPVSFFYCYSTDGELLCIAVEVNNTFGERHLYILTKKEPPADGLPFHFFTEKQFHVSPFNNLDGRYEFFFSEVGDSIDIRIHLIREQATVFKARLSGRAQPLTPLHHVKTFLRRPLMPHLTVPRIYWEAFRLYFQKKMAYHDKPVTVNPMTIVKKPSLIQTICIRVVRRALGRIQTGFLSLTMPDGRTSVFGDSDSEVRGDMVVNDYQFFTRVVFNGEIGLGESYMNGEWDSPRLTDVFSVFVENMAALSGGNLPTSIIAQIRERKAERNRQNTVSGSKDNIYRHYDLGNDFYQLFLDAGMNYSCAFFPTPDTSLEDAQKAKLDKIIEKAQIRKDDHVLEIGCGWGGFAVRAARKTGCRVTGITVSEAQFAYATDRVRRLGLDDQVTILLEDYRNMTQTFDKIVSIEMLEAVGHEYFSLFFKCCDRLLTPDGLMVIQSITIPDDRYDQYRKKRDWIQKYIFPGGHLPSLTAICNSMSKHTGFTIENLENIGIHYVPTLREWRRRLAAQQQTLEDMGFNRMFQRKWHYYFSICEAGFVKRELGDVQIVFTRPNNHSLPTF
jgi:cyclopropane-fatty-acyl-phospholipid synthase